MHICHSILQFIQLSCFSSPDSANVQNGHHQIYQSPQLLLHPLRPQRLFTSLCCGTPSQSPRKPKIECFEPRSSRTQHSTGRQRGKVMERIQIQTDRPTRRPSNLACLNFSILNLSFPRSSPPCLSQKPYPFFLSPFSPPASLSHLSLPFPLPISSQLPPDRKIMLPYNTKTTTRNSNTNTETVQSDNTKEKKNTTAIINQGQRRLPRNITRQRTQARRCRRERVHTTPGTGRVINQESQPQV